ncbi:hypothetical protein G7Y89_g1067 [Cudoniella acicularis]|uniref:Uncharacterized protein n=1 Tax=Cudoniella acicularis TaxID=354080 RepID=A0A8H4RX18_9HELO|nr:hypothetical protein G7Y89_g1067 [Cudoniella acicularis]
MTAPNAPVPTVGDSSAKSPERPSSQLLVPVSPSQQQFGFRPTEKGQTSSVGSDVEPSQISEPPSPGLKKEASGTIFEIPSELDEGDDENHQGIWWKSPTLMIGFLILGIAACSAHHGWYAHLSGRQVGDDISQQWALRAGNAFAFLSNTCFVASASFAYTQWLWKVLQTQEFKVKGLEAVFGFDNSISAVVKVKYMRKLGWAALIALIVCQTQTTSFAFSAVDPTTNTIIFLGPRTLIYRLSTATATAGQILTIIPPFVNSSYSLDFYGPYVQCQQANETEAGIISSLRNQSISQITGDTLETDNCYFAFVPDFGLLNSGTTPDHGVQMVSQERLQEPGNASNEIWMVYSRWAWNSSGQQTAVDRYTTCQLWNASYTIDLSFQEGSQNITKHDLELKNLVPYPTPYQQNSPDVIVQHSYSAVMWALTDLLVGSMGLFSQISNGTNTSTITNFSEITTTLERTSLLGSSDLDVFFDKNHWMTNNISGNYTPSAQRQADIEFAGNKTLEELIPELAFNTTVGFMNNWLLSYKHTILLLSYGLAIFFALLANLSGAYAYLRNGVAHDRGFAAVMAATRDPHIGEGFDERMAGRLPVQRKIRDMKMRYEQNGVGGGKFRRVLEVGTKKKRVLRRVSVWT